jgi:hypothetical protein
VTGLSTRAYPLGETAAFGVLSEAFSEKVISTRSAPPASPYSAAVFLTWPD